jgi:hypothetical protein
MKQIDTMVNDMILCMEDSVKNAPKKVKIAFYNTDIDTKHFHTDGINVHQFALQHHMLIAEMVDDVKLLKTIASRFKSITGCQVEYKLDQGWLFEVRNGRATTYSINGTGVVKRCIFTVKLLMDESIIDYSLNLQNVF